MSIEIEKAILETLLKLIDHDLSKGKSEFDLHDLKNRAMEDPIFEGQSSSSINIAFKPILNQGLRELLENVFNNDQEAVSKLILLLSNNELPRAVRDFIIATLAKGLKYQYDGPRQVLRDTLINSNAELRHEYTEVIDISYQHALEEISSTEYKPRAPSLTKTLYKKNPDDTDKGW